MTIAHLYFAFLLIGGIGLLGSLIFGDFDGDLDTDIGDNDISSSESDSPKILSLRVIFSFLVAFSIGAGSLYLGDKPLWQQIIVGFSSGIIISVLVYYFMRFLYSFQGVSNISSDDFINKNGIVTIGTTTNGLCQIEVDSSGGDRLFMAKENTDIYLRKNDVVKIIKRMGNILIVTKLH